jgi:hypothetical protein
MMRNHLPDHKPPEQVTAGRRPDLQGVKDLRRRLPPAAAGRALSHAGDSPLPTVAVAGTLSTVNVQPPIDPEEMRAAGVPACQTRTQTPAELGGLNDAAAAQVTAAVALRRRIRAGAARAKRHCVSGPDEP